MPAPDPHLLTPPEVVAVPVTIAIAPAAAPPRAPAAGDTAARTRGFGSQVDGTAFPPERVEAVWRTAREIPGFDPDLWRLDANGDAICRPDYRCAEFRFGWEIDHVRPVALGGDDDDTNLQPLRIDTNRRRKGDRYPWPEP
jgi:hypothetical protein